MSDSDDIRSIHTAAFIPLNNFDLLLFESSHKVALALAIVTWMKKR